MSEADTTDLHTRFSGPPVFKVTCKITSAKRRNRVTEGILSFHAGQLYASWGNQFRRFRLEPPDRIRLALALLGGIAVKYPWAQSDVECLEKYAGMARAAFEAEEAERWEVQGD